MNIKVYTPDVLDEAVNFLQQDGGHIIAGGTDLIIELRKEKLKPEFLVDLTFVNELRGILVSDETIEIGAMTTFEDLINSEYIKAELPSLWECAINMGACQIQNRATIGGNICNAAAAADSIPVFMALEAECIIAGADGIRKMSIDSFILGTGKNSLQKGELLKAVAFKRPQKSEINSFAKLGKRNALAISTIACAVRVKVDNRIITEAFVSTGSLGSKAGRELGVEVYLMGKSITDLNIDEAAEVLSAEVEERLKSRASIAYKKHAVKGVFKEAIEKCIKRANQ